MCVLGAALCEPVDAGICGCSWRFLVPGEAGLPPPLPEAGGAKPAPWKRDGHYWASVRCQALKRALDREVPVWRRTLRLREVHVRPRSSRPVQLLGCHWFPSCPPRLWQKGESASVCISADKCPVKLFQLHGAGHQRGHQPPQRGLPAGEAREAGGSPEAPKPLSNTCPCECGPPAWCYLWGLGTGCCLCLNALLRLCSPDEQTLQISVWTPLPRGGSPCAGNHPPHEPLLHGAVSL